jgi:hypothetical protein
MDMKNQRAFRLRKLMLNHAAFARNTGPTGWAVLSAGIVSTCLIAYLVQHTGSEIRAMESEIEVLQHPQDRPATRMSSSKESPEKREEIMTVNAAMNELRLPWEALFGVLENIDTPHVRLITLEPNARQRKIRVTAETDDIGSMLVYVQILSRQTILENVMLMTHEQHNDGRIHPVSFVIEAAWLI